MRLNEGVLLEARLPGTRLSRQRMEGAGGGQGRAHGPDGVWRSVVRLAATSKRGRWARLGASLTGCRAVETRFAPERIGRRAQLGDASEESRG